MSTVDSDAPRSRLPSAFEVSRLAAASELGPARAAAFRDAVATVDDWGPVLEVAAFHKVLPLLYVHLRDHAHDPPDRVVAALRDHAVRYAGHVLFLSSEMGRIAGRLRADDVPFLVLKGPSLTAAYGSVAKRPFVDNDLLIDRADFGRIERALLDLGFNQRKRSDRQQAGYLSVYGEYTFGRAAGDLASTVDVHTRLVPPGLPYAPDLDHLLARSRQIKVAGARVPALSWEDLFVALSVNALKDQWDRLRLASDIAAVGAMVEDWPAVWSRAKRGGSARAVRLAVLVSADAVDASFPDAVLRPSLNDRHAVALAARVTASMSHRHAAEVLSWVDRVRLTMGAQDGVSGKLRYAGYSALRRVRQRSLDPHGR